MGCINCQFLDVVVGKDEFDEAKTNHPVQHDARDHRHFFFFKVWQHLFYCLFCMGEHPLLDGLELFWVSYILDFKREYLAELIDDLSHDRFSCRPDLRHGEIIDWNIFAWHIPDGNACSHTIALNGVFLDEFFTFHMLDNPLSFEEEDCKDCHEQHRKAKD